ncbi:MAG TPA: hypothetical protein VMF58_18430 [Rhizomicrobium sp.]|nr:hypothetical protein [Rhizomicrobium sp.]
MKDWLERWLERARRRNLDRIAATYAVVGWLLVQVASIALPAFDAPPWTLRWLIVAAIVGFPLALAIGWTVNKSGDTAEPATLKRHEAVLLAVIGVIALLTLGELAWHWSQTPAPAAVAMVPGAPAGSVAVLPFDNISGDPKQKYFSEGISDEIIGLLARNPSLRVAARTSSFFFEGKNEDARTIARKLNVRSLLEGSVRADGNRVRIEASLVNAEDGYQIWTQSYDRSLSDILAVQSDIANAITHSLAPTLTGVHLKPSVPKPVQIDPDVYRDYLRAQVFFDQRSTEQDTPETRMAVMQALALFRSVAQRAPDYADGLAAYGDALRASGTGAPQDVQSVIARALKLDPTNPEALQVSASIATDNRDWDTAIDDGLILQRSQTRTASGAFALARIYRNFGLNDEAEREFRNWVHLDPYSAPAWSMLGELYFAAARYEEAIRAADESQKIQPDNVIPLEYKCVSLATLDRLPDARATLDRLVNLNAPAPLISHCRFFVLLHGESAKAAVAFIDNALAHGNADALGDTADIGFMLSHAGADDQAMDFYEKAFATKDEWGFWFYPGASAPARFLQSKRWIAFSKQPEYRRWLDACARARRVLGDAHAERAD